MHARVTDPATSEETLAAMGRSTTLLSVVAQAARQLMVFTDDELTERVEGLTFTRQQRNVIARTRKRLVDTGQLKLTPETKINGANRRVQVFAWVG